MIRLAKISQQIFVNQADDRNNILSVMETAATSTIRGPAVFCTQKTVFLQSLISAD